jgi:prepilin-type N-terminal cleavage/methylation domain-containing protein
MTRATKKQSPKGFTTPSEKQHERTGSCSSSESGGNPRTRGFTLIELLVVIAIIGILSAVVLGSLNMARTRANDAAVKSNLAGIRSPAELYYDIYKRYSSSGGGAYTGDCLTTAALFRETSITGEGRTIADSIAAAIAAAHAAGNGSKQCRLDATRANYMIAIGLEGSSTYWCIDNTGTAKDIGASLPAAGVVACE